MRAIIIGAGKVGYHIADTLSRDHYDVVVMDRSDAALERVRENLDVMTIHANGLISKPVRDLGVGPGDLLIAVTASDEANMLACFSAKNMGVGNTIARIRNHEYARDLAVSKELLEIDHVINPELSTAQEIVRSLTFSPAGHVEEFAKGVVRMVEISIEGNGGLSTIVDIPLKSIRHFPEILIAAIARNGELIIPRGDDSVQQGDKIFVVGKKSGINEFCTTIGKTPRRIRNVMVAGGGLIAVYLAEDLQKLGVSVKIIEKSPARCRELSQQLPQTLIISGDGTDPDLLSAENVEDMDAFVALTGIDEENMLMAMLAKRMGVGKTIAKVSRINYISLVETLGIDAVITPSITTAAEILRYVRGGEYQSLSLLLGGQAAAMEFTVREGCGLADKKLMDIDFPRDAIVTNVIHKGRVAIPRGNTTLRVGDQLIVLSRASEVSNVRNMFRCGEENPVSGLWNSIKNYRSTLSR